ncbi:hypothetical protein [Erythrobacter sp. HL-111]|uniref:hypothetical protein n=1 Tax=Erythrobacter sp. HL-111 TaxID=1798193 RepID=UPI0006D9ABAE|nr:hypothetical protein [Erythrobacter sp. HL-111]KPP90275.1 MAG: transcriptional regulator [Erythrobacteraceae bacterium HL-111]SDR85469.1 hypothetical protein SAMN04515621_0506 [Erythrobacter sp. HL-111]
MDAMIGAKTNRLFKALQTAVEELGPNLPPRQLMALLLIAEADRVGSPIGVRDIDRALGDLPNGSASKLLKTMMHTEGPRKAGVANTVISERDPTDLRRYTLTLTPKGRQIVEKVLRHL